MKKDVAFKSIESLEQIDASEVDKSFLEQLHNDNITKHCTNAMRMTYAKKGPINDFVARKALPNFEVAMKAFDEDGNAEHLIDAINYLMIRQMFYTHEQHKCLQMARQVAKQYRESDYRPTDSTGSTSIDEKPMTWAEYIRQHMGAYPDKSQWRW